MLKSIRDITGQVIDRDELETWYAERDRLKKKKKTTKEERGLIKELQHKIYMMMYIPQYITVTMDSVGDMRSFMKMVFILTIGGLSEFLVPLLRHE